MPRRDVYDPASAGPASAGPLPLAALQARLQETHHRVKNHLQIVASLLSLQAHRAETSADLFAAASLREAQRRIVAIARLQEHLQRASGAERISVRPFMDSLCEDLARCLGAEGADAIRFALNVDQGEMPGDKAMAVALILNELATNAVKHAYPDGEGIVRVALQRGIERWKLTVADDGPGFGEARLAERGSLGLALVNALAEEIGGVVKVNKPVHGAAISVEFSVSERETSS